MTTQYGFFHNNNECVGCKTCVIACKDKNDLPLGEKFRRVYDYGGGSWDVSAKGIIKSQDVYVYSVSVACMHCAAPACQAMCPVAAISKREDGIVIIDPNQCIGCGSCATACPYKAPYLSDEKGYARKCDFCAELLDNGEQPVCVASCPMRCLSFGELSALQTQYGTVDSVAPLPADSNTGPSIVFKPSRLNPEGKLSGSILNDDEEIISAAV